MEFSQKLKELRKERNLTQSELAHILNYDNTIIADYEAGRNEPNIKNLIKIANIFDVSVDYLIGNSDTYYQLKKLWYKKIESKFQQHGIILEKSDYFFIEIFYDYANEIINRKDNTDECNINDIFQEMIFRYHDVFFHIFFEIINKNNDTYRMILKNAISEEWNMKNDCDTL